MTAPPEQPGQQTPKDPTPDSGDAGTPAETPPPRQSPTIEPRRLILIIAIAIGGLAYLFWDDVRDVVKPPEIVEVTVPPDALLESHQVQVKSGRLDITFTRIGAAITHLTWTAPDDQVETLISQEDVPNRALVVDLPGSNEWSDHEFKFLGKTVDDGITKLRFERNSLDDGLRLVKTFAVHSDKPLIQLDVTIHVNTPDAPSSARLGKEGYVLHVANAVGTPSELDKDDCLVSVRSNLIVDHHRVRRISGEQDWPTEAERRRAAHGHREVPPTLEWVATASKYFGLIVRPPPSPGQQGLFDARMKFERTHDCAAAVQLVVPPPKEPGADIHNTFHVYAGPKHYDALARLSKQSDPPGRQQECIDYWWFGYETTRLLKLLHDTVVPNYGVAIIILTLIFRLLMWPVTRYNLKSLVDIKVANARLADIDAREPPRSDIDGHDWWLKEARVWENVQRKATLGVFLPLAILLPILLILYYTLNAGYEFYRQPFILWITDISQPDPVFLLPILMGLGMMAQLGTMSENRAKERAWIIMPVAFTIIFAFFSAGLVLFWFVDSLAGWLQLLIIKRGRRRSGAKTAGDKAELLVQKIRDERAAAEAADDDAEPK